MLARYVLTSTTKPGPGCWVVRGFPGHLPPDLSKLDPGGPWSWCGGCRFLMGLLSHPLLPHLFLQTHATGLPPRVLAPPRGFFTYDSPGSYVHVFFPKVFALLEEEDYVPAECCRHCFLSLSLPVGTKSLKQSQTRAVPPLGDPKRTPSSEV